ncbi:methenyltetrahydrofolate synthase domain-containing protein isoform X2 [Silurus meridionalis]|uniref:methenyltetrahydrofolate synthase domain-containing protein isoform X2 n=1 Tax=Silurus meridionalis TaxID=175797 RepID=UPI001EEBB0F6|nr:methenyltetrahydrofolate synthase domain-containing protein isoform X2 [Silurus meridionalis]
METAIIIPKEATKWEIRQKVWDYLEEKDLAKFPRPVHHRIPNFKSATAACDRLPVLQVFQSSSVVKVNPDKPQERARFHTLHAGKTLLVPTPRLRTGLFNKIIPPPGATKEDLRVCSMSQGVKEFSVPVGLDASVHVDLVVVGSVAVSEKGYRIGKGEGYSDMEYAMMVSMGAVNESTVVVTVVHDCQVVDIPEGLMESHDLTVDYIFTPSRIIRTECKIPKPKGIMWSKFMQIISSWIWICAWVHCCPGTDLGLLSCSHIQRRPTRLCASNFVLDAEMLGKIPILKKLRDLEQKGGKDVTLKMSQTAIVKTEQRHKPKPSPDPKHDLRHDLPTPRRDHTPAFIGSGKEAERSPAPVNTLYVGGLPAGLRVSELKGFLKDRDAVPVRLTWQGAEHRAFLQYSDERASDQALDALQGLCINGQTLHIERAKGQNSFRKPGATKRQSKS